MKRIFSGIQPSGEIHIGNYVGAIRNWSRLADDYDCIFSIVDLHAMTIEYDVSEMRERIIKTAAINFASGLTPDRCIFFVQSHVKEHAELAWIFNCITPIGELERMTQFKMKAQQHRANVNMGLLDYPVLQAADILLYKAEFVPVGEDQVQHVELTRDIARRFNNRFGETFPLPDVLLSDAPKILGTDGKSKMSKSMNNYIGLLESEDVIWEKIRTAVTDENRKRRSDPGNPSICNIYTIHTAFSSPEELDMIDRECRKAGIGCIDCKKILMKNLWKEIAPIQEKAKGFLNNENEVKDILRDGAKKCKQISESVMAEVKEKTGISPF